MSKLAVRYNNDLNSMPLRDFTVNELNIFITICANIKDKGTDKVIYNFDKIRELSNYEFTGIDRFVNDLRNTYRKLLATSFTTDDGNVIESFTLFNWFKITRDTQTVEIEVSDYFKYILNDLNLGNFTRFELKEYTDINSTYSKAIYMRLKQWKSIGKWEVTIDEFRRLLSVPDSYKMGNIDQKILNPAMKDLKPYFDNLKISKLDRRKKTSGRGRPVAYILITFKPQDDNIMSIKGKGKYALGKYNNIYLTEEEHKEVVYQLKKKYLIDEVSEWKNKINSDQHNNDIALIRKFAKNKDKYYE